MFTFLVFILTPPLSEVCLQDTENIDDGKTSGDASSEADKLAVDGPNNEDLGPLNQEPNDSLPSMPLHSVGNNTPYNSIFSDKTIRRRFTW